MTWDDVGGRPIVDTVEHGNGPWCDEAPLQVAPTLTEVCATCKGIGRLSTAKTPATCTLDTSWHHCPGCLPNRAHDDLVTPHCYHCYLS